MIFIPCTFRTISTSINQARFRKEGQKVLPLPVGRDDGVLLPDAGLDPWADGLLAGAEMAEATDRLLLVQVGRGGLHAADHHHLPANKKKRLVRKSWLQLVHGFWEAKLKFAFVTLRNRFPFSLGGESGSKCTRVGEKVMWKSLCMSRDWNLTCYWTCTCMLIPLSKSHRWLHSSIPFCHTQNDFHLTF